MADAEPLPQGRPAGSGEDSGEPRGFRVEPSLFVPLDALRRTPNRKLDRQDLPRQSEPAPASATAAVETHLLADEAVRGTETRDENG